MLLLFFKGLTGYSSLPHHLIHIDLSYFVQAKGFGNIEEGLKITSVICMYFKKIKGEREEKTDLDKVPEVTDKWLLSLTASYI